MVELKNAVKLSHKVAVYVPSTVNVNEKVNSSRIVSEVMITMSNLFGGCSSVSLNGGWISDKKGLITEKITMVYSFCDSKSFNQKNIDKLGMIAEKIKTDMKQEAVSIEIDSKLYLI